MKTRFALLILLFLTACQCPPVQRTTPRVLRWYPTTVVAEHGKLFGSSPGYVWHVAEGHWVLEEVR